MSAYELHIGVKDYCFGRDDQLIGVSVMQLKDIMDQVVEQQIPLFHSNISFAGFLCLLALPWSSGEHGRDRLDDPENSQPADDGRGRQGVRQTQVRGARRDAAALICSSSGEDAQTAFCDKEGRWW